jgi:hypothetical protein
MDITLKRRLGFFFIILLSLFSLTYSVFQVKKATMNPTLEIEREIFTSADNMINATGRGLAVFNLKYSSYENPFLNYSGVTSSVSDPEVLSTRFIRSIGGLPQSIEYLLFRSEVNNTDNVVSVNYTLALSHDFIVEDDTTLVIYLHTNTNETTLSLLGEDSQGNEIELMFDLSEAYNQYLLFIEPLSDIINVIKKVNVNNICQPLGYFKVENVFRILNLFDSIPAIDTVNLKKGQWWVRINDVEFPHRFHWEPLKALNVTSDIRLTVFPESSQTLNTLNYSWAIPDLGIVTTIRTLLIFTFSSSVEAPITKAEIILEEPGGMNVIDVTQNIIEALLDGSSNIRLEVPIPNYTGNCQVVVSYLYWSTLWSSLFLVSLSLIIIASIGFLIARRKGLVQNF